MVALFDAVRSMCVDLVSDLASMDLLEAACTQRGTGNMGYADLGHSIGVENDEEGRARLAFGATCCVFWNVFHKLPVKDPIRIWWIGAAERDGIVKPDDGTCAVVAGMRWYLSRFVPAAAHMREDRLKSLFAGIGCAETVIMEQSTMDLAMHLFSPETAQSGPSAVLQAAGSSAAGRQAESSATDDGAAAHAAALAAAFSKPKISRRSSFNVHSTSLPF
jgi:hypothetical protein